MEHKEDVRLATFLCTNEKSSQDWGRLYPGQTLLLDRLFYCRLEWYLGVSESRSQEEGALLCVLSASHVIPRGAWMTLDARTHTMQNPGQPGSTALYLLLETSKFTTAVSLNRTSHKLICCWHTSRSTYTPPNNVMCTKIARAVHVSLWLLP